MGCNWSKQISTLDHVSNQNDSDHSIVVSNTGLDIALMLFFKENKLLNKTANSSGNFHSIPQRTRKKLESDFKLYILNFIIDVFKVFNSDFPNKFIYDPHNHECMDNVTVWQKYLRMVEDNKIQENDIWNVNL